MELKVVGISSLLFKLEHPNPVVIVFASIFGLGFAHVAVATNTIRIGVVIHAMFDLFIDLPDSTNGSNIGRYPPPSSLC